MVQLALFIAAGLSLLMGLFVLLNNPKSILFKTYFYFGIISCLWMVDNAFSITGQYVYIKGDSLLFVGRLITPLALLSSFTFFIFIKLFRRKTLDLNDAIYFLPVLAVCLFSFTNLNVFISSGQLTLGPLYGPYLTVLIFNVALIFRYLYFNNKRDGLNSRERAQLLYLKVGTIGAILPALFFGAIIPIYSNSTLANLGPLFSVVFLLFAGLAMVKQHLFDVKLVVIRSLVYLLALSFIAGAFTLLTIFISDILFQGTDIQSKYLRIIYIVLTLLLALIFPPLKRFFDRITNHLFYRDAYDTQLFFDKLNKLLVSTYQLSALLEGTLNLIFDTVHPTYCAYLIRQPDSNHWRIVKVPTSLNIDGDFTAAVETFTRKMHSQVDVVDDFDEIAGQAVKRTLQAYGVAVVAKLDTTHRNENIGYLIFGFKKSGSPYNSQDANVIEIITNELVVAIQNALSFEEIKNFNATLQGKIDDATRKLRSANQKLKELDETKDDFISMASHQLRTPLTSVKGYLSMVLEGDAGRINKTEREMLGQAFFSSQRMVYLIADLLNVSRLKSGKFIIESNKVNLSELVIQELEQLKEIALARNVKLTFEKPDIFPDLMLDETKTRQVIMNFVDNAIYYTPAGGHIEVRLINNLNSIELRVKDDGIGVTKSEQPHLFTKFYRASNARKARPDGTGLGLFMAKKVIIAEGGSLIFESEQGRGSTFGFIFSKSHVAVKK
jgi:signal transduction histidine kinase